MSMTPSLLSDNTLKTFAERAPGYDANNRFFAEDFEDLKEARYLVAPVPKELGGLGYNLEQMCLEQRRLAYFAPATALAVNMHVYWLGLIADLWRAGDKSLEWVLKEAALGEVFAAGHAETGNDVPVLASTTRAERVDGGYRFTGHKSFGSLGPAWTRLGLHGMDTSDAEHPKIVHAFARRETPGLAIKPTWDNVLGMRATRSDDTILEGAFVPDKDIARVVPAGFAGADLFVLGIFAWALMGFGNVYYGLARRALDMTVERVKSKKSVALARPSMAYHGGYQQAIAECVLDLEAIGPHLDRVSHDWATGVNHGPFWPVKIVAAKCHAVEGAFRVVDRCLDIYGGFGIFPAAGIERLFRDARLGRIHPASGFLAREICGKAMLGVDLDAQPR
jgi:alkylation response protein AidB-like acyl-CoA dehydrogenase